MIKTLINIKGMSCEHCVQEVTEAVNGLPGIKSVKVKLNKAQAVVKFDETVVSLEDIKNAITEEGFEASY